MDREVDDKEQRLMSHVPSAKSPPTDEAAISPDEADWIIPFDMTMERASVFIPDYLDRLLGMISAKQGQGKAKFIRNAIIREVARYIEELEKPKNHNQGKFAPLACEPDDWRHVANDTETNRALLKSLYDRFAAHDGLFPDPAQLHYKPR